VSRALKYVIVRDVGMQVPILCDDLLVHAAIAHCYPVVSAGFCEVDALGNVRVFGGSESLGRQHRDEDAVIIKNLLAMREPFPVSRVLSVDHTPASLNGI
jgi:hypothetical protein